MNGETEPVSTQDPDGVRVRRPATATFGIVLIVTGALLLVARFVPGLAWWSAWPLIIVVAGVVQAVTPGKTGWSVFRLLDGLVTVAIGLAFLGWTTGWLGGGFLGNLLSMWPVLVISLGFDLLSNALHARWLKAVGPVLVISAIALAVVASATGGTIWTVVPAGAEEAVAFSEPVGDVTEADLDLQAGVAGLRIGSGQDLVSVQGSSPFGQPDMDVVRSGQSADAKIRLAGGGVYLPGTGDAELDVALSDRVAWNMTVQAGVAEVDADLSGLDVRSLVLKPGVASCTVRLGEPDPSASQAEARIEAGISSVRVHVPQGVEARVESQSGLTAHSIGGEFKSLGPGIWETPGYGSGGSGTWLIRVKSGIGSIVIDSY